MAVGQLAPCLARGHHHLGGVDHDDVVAGVDVGGQDRAVLAAQDPCHLGGQAAEHEPVGVDDVPRALDLGWLWAYVGTESFLGSVDPMPRHGGRSAGALGGLKNRAFGVAWRRPTRVAHGHQAQPAGGRRRRQRRHGPPTAAPSTTPATLGRPGRPRPGARRANGPSGGRRRRPRCRGAGAGPQSGLAEPAASSPSGPPHQPRHAARRTRRSIGSSARLPGGRRQKAPKSCSPTTASVAAAMAPEARGGRRRARPAGRAAGRGTARSTPGSGSGGRWPSGGRRTPRAPARRPGRRSRDRAGG